MSLTSAQAAALAADIANNTAVISYTDDNGPQSMQIKNTPNVGPSANAIAAWYNQVVTSPSTYWVWRSDVSRSDVYALSDDAGGSWNWATYKAQTVTEQGAWVQMFMGDKMNMGAVNNRAGIQAIFGGTSPGNAQRDHCFAVGRKAATNIEKLLAVAVTSPPANTGNDGVANNRGKTTNPDQMGFDGSVNGLLGQDVYAARGGT